MQIFKCGKTTVVCKFESTRNGFRHTAELFYDLRHICSDKVCYLNRTWEGFEFKTVLQKLIDKAEVHNWIPKRQITNFRKKILCR
jgi:hypothetical protein